MLKLCEASSPEGEKLTRLANEGFHEAMPLLVNGAPGRPLEALILLIRGAVVAGGQYAYLDVRLMDTDEASAWDPELAGLASAAIPHGHMLFCALVGRKALLALKPLPEGLAELRRLAEFGAPSPIGFDDVPEPSDSPNASSRSPLLDRLLAESADRVTGLVRSAVHLGIDLTQVAVFVTPGGDGAVDLAPRVELADRATLLNELVVGRMRPEQIRAVGADSVCVIHMAPDGLALSHVQVPTDSRGTTRGKTGRNERCPCGSGKKFKSCCIN